MPPDIPTHTQTRGVGYRSLRVDEGLRGDKYRHSHGFPRDDGGNHTSDYPAYPQQTTMVQHNLSQLTFYDHDYHDDDDNGMDLDVTHVYYQHRDHPSVSFSHD